MRTMQLLPLALLAAAWTAHPLPFTLVNGETAKKALPATMPGGFAVFDFDNDGKLDIYFPNGGDPRGGNKAPGKLLKNLGGMRFSEVAAGLEGKDYNFGAAAGDFDGDGYVDLLVSGLHGVTLYRNLGNGKFADVTTKSGINNKGRWSVAAAWLDIDADRDLDLLLVNYVRWNPAAERECIVEGKPDFCHPRYYDPEPNALFRNNGDGTFADISEESGIAAHKGKGMSAAVADFDADGRPDMFVTNDKMFASLFLNRDGKFVESAFDWAAAVPREGNTVSGMGVDAQDFNNDGLPDLIYTALQDETFPLLRNTGKEFAEVPSLSVVTRSMAGWGIAFADLDNDGWKDIAVARSGALSRRSEPLSWFRNTGQGKFIPQTLPAPAAMYRGLVAADFDNDGCLDLAVTALNGQAQILKNPCSGGNWLKVAPSGARVRVGNQWREPSTAVGYASSYAGPLHFGLGTATEVDVEVNGTVRRVKANTEVQP